MILVIDVSVTDPSGDILTGSVAVQVNVPGAQAPAQAAAPADEVPDFIKRSLMMSRGLGRL
jgi:hypothetical protein